MQERGEGAIIVNQIPIPAESPVCASVDVPARRRRAHPPQASLPVLRRPNLPQALLCGKALRRSTPSAIHPIRARCKMTP
jgi:hypothetical protein